MKKTFKRLGAALLAMAMAVSVLCTGALAAGTNSITITTTSSGHKYEAYQVFTGTLATVDGKKILSNIEWGTGVDTAEKTSGEGDTATTTSLLKEVQAISITTSDSESPQTPFSNCKTAADVAKVLSGEKDSSDIVKEFAKVVAKNLSNTKTDFTENKTTDQAGNQTTTGYTASSLDAGYYLVKDADNSTEIDAFTDYILEVTDATNVTPKSSVPKVEKKIVEGNTDKDATTANIGDDVEFKLTATLPTNYGDYSKYELTFHDLLSSGLTLDENSITVVAKSNAESSQDITLTKDTEYTVKTGTSTSENDSSKCNLEVAINNMKTDEQLKNLPAGSTITVTYKAKLNANAVLGTTDGGNSNKVKLEYSNDPNNTDKKGTTPEDEVKVYTFQMNVVKKDGTGEDAKALAGAKFVLAKEQINDFDSTKISTEEYTSKLVGANGSAPTYTVGGTNYEMTVSDAEATKGQLNIKGLKDGTYYLYETVAPEGYNKLTEPIKIVITAGQDEKNVLNGTVSATVTSKNAEGTEQTSNITEKTGTDEKGILNEITVVNNAGSQLPSTGGMGTTLFYIIGGVLMAGAAIVLVIKKKRSSAE